MGKILESLSGNRTYLIAILGKIAALVAALALGLNGNYYEAFTAIMALFGFAGMASTRAGIAKAEKSAKIAIQATDELKVTIDRAAAAVASTRE